MNSVLQNQGISTSLTGERLNEVAASASDRLLRQLDVLLNTDPDEQRANPLALVRESLREPTEYLLSVGAQPVPRDEFAQTANPHDVFGIAPAAWSDIDTRLHEPGLEWGAWKAATILIRRRDEGLR